MTVNNNHEDDSMSELQLRGKRLRQLVYIYTIVVSTTLALVGLFIMLSGLRADLYGEVISVLGIVAVVALELLVISNYYAKRKFAQLDEMLQEFEHDSRALRGRLDEIVHRNESLIASLSLEVSNMRDSIGSFSKLLPSIEPSVSEQYRLKDMIESVKKNANLFLHIVDTYDHLKMLKASEFVELRELMEMIVTAGDIPKNRADEAFDKFRRDFPEYVTIERDRRGTTFVRIRKK